jgi:hypothetical protein
MNRINFITLCIICSNPLVFAQTPTPSVKATEFPLGVWYEGGVGAARQNSVPEDPATAAKQYDRDFADMAKHGINCAVVPNTPPPHHKPILDAAQKHGLKLIIELGLDGGDIGQMIRGTKPLDMDQVQKIFEKDLAPIKDHPALWKVQLLDEPAAGEPLAHYAKIAEALRKYDPAHDPFCCLAGVGSVGDFSKITHSPIVAWDCYPVGNDTKPGDKRPLQALADASTTANEQALKANAQTWAVIQCFTITNNNRFPTCAEIRSMTWLSLATGSRGIFWFIYGTQAFDPARTTIMAGLVDEKGKGSDRWEEVAKLSKEISALAPTLNELTPLFASKLASSNQFTTVLKDSQGRHYVFVVNMDSTKPQKASLRFGTPSEVAGDAEVFHLPDNKKVPITHDGAEVVWDQELAPGDGALFRIE